MATEHVGWAKRTSSNKTEQTKDVFFGNRDVSLVFFSRTGLKFISFRIQKKKMDPAVSKHIWNKTTKKDPTCQNKKKMHFGKKEKYDSQSVN